MGSLSVVMIGRAVGNALRDLDRKAGESVECLSLNSSLSLSLSLSWARLRFRSDRSPVDRFASDSDRRCCLRCDFFDELRSCGLSLRSVLSLRSLFSSLSPLRLETLGVSADWLNTMERRYGQKWGRATGTRRVNGGDGRWGGGV